MVSSTGFSWIKFYSIFSSALENYDGTIISLFHVGKNKSDIPNIAMERIDEL
jgi:hypothetical protein